MNFGMLFVFLMCIVGGGYIDRDSEYGWMRGAGIGLLVFLFFAATLPHASM